jgi:hypothetical protein
MGLAALILALEAVRNHQPGELALLAPALAAVVAIIARASAVFRTTPTGFPDSSPDPGAVLR